MNPKILNAIGKALASRSRNPPRCPNCMAALRSIEQVGTLGLMQTSVNAAPVGWLVCKPCWNAGVSDARMERLIARADADPGTFIVTLIQHPAMAASGHADKPCLFGDPESAWSSDDRAWFEQHPGRAHRLRERHQGETGIDPGNLVLVTQLEPGVRLRQSVHGHPGLIVQLGEDDLWAFAAANLAAERQIA